MWFNVDLVVRAIFNYLFRGIVLRDLGFGSI